MSTMTFLPVLLMVYSGTPPLSSIVWRMLLICEWMLPILIGSMMAMARTNAIAALNTCLLHCR